MAVIPKVQKVVVPFNQLPPARLIPENYHDVVAKYTDRYMVVLTAADWSDYGVNPDKISITLPSNMIAYESDTGLYKLGNGENTWRGTTYSNKNGYYLRYRVVSEDKNSLSHWSPIAEVVKPKIDANVIDGGAL